MVLGYVASEDRKNRTYRSIISKRRSGVNETPRRGLHHISTALPAISRTGAWITIEQDGAQGGGELANLVRRASGLLPIAYATERQPHRNDLVGRGLIQCQVFVSRHRLADLPVISVRIDNRSDSPALLIFGCPDDCSAGSNGFAERGVRVVHNHRHPSSPSPDRFGTEMLGRLVGHPELRPIG